ncbi:BCCT family transporter [Nocardioides sp. JQ2195]|uniref:BCCT family transporter n=1 Tax=Nocardioides sp. JQ2195 TaxID=2592334 RepID=UPI00143EE81C|nr:BCCT family transporter [Nocardioides sp. JQ2195]QIX25418.1 BCCT family transporter [Nocardioides sp. JQ2195]
MTAQQDPPHSPDESVGHAHPALDYPAEVELAQDTSRIDWIVFGVTAAIAVGFLVWGFVDTAGLGSASGTTLAKSMQYLGWFFVLTASGFVVFAIWLALGKYGNIPLGRDGDDPEFRTSSWIAMMFSAGMGIGLMFYGVSEPLTFFAGDATDPAAPAGIPGTDGADQVELARKAMAQTLFHWTLHPWAIYAVVGLAIAYGVFRKGRLQLISSVFEPLLGSHVHGPIGKVIDMLAIFATLFGSAASLGLGALQIKTGLELFDGVGTIGNGILVALIAFLTCCFILSAVSGVGKGIQYLSNINMVLALLLAVFVFVVGPTMFILNFLPSAIAEYAGDMPEMAGRVNGQGAYTESWLTYYTVFYWAWWISWTPFVGMFIARISKGRTIRQFVTGVLLVPSLVSLVWFAIFGGTAIKFQMDFLKEPDRFPNIFDGGAEAQLFNTLDQLPMSMIASVLVMILVAIFFVSGADAASIVMGSLSQHGALEPKRAPVVFWGVATGAVAAVMLLIGGDTALNGLKNITIVAAVPFVFVMVGLCISLVKDLSQDPLVVRRQYAVEAVHAAVVTGVTEHGDDFALTVQKDEHGNDRVVNEKGDEDSSPRVD